MTRTIIAAGVLIALSTACSTLIGLDDFHPAGASEGGTGGENDGGSGTGGMGGTSGGGSAGDGGYVVPNPNDCIRATLSDSFVVTSGGGVATWRIPLALSLGDAAYADEVEFRIRSAAANKQYQFTPELLKSGDKNCFTCGQINVDVGNPNPGLYSAVAGTFDVGILEENIYRSQHAFSLKGFIFAQSEIVNGQQTPIVGGSCLYVPTTYLGHDETKTATVDVSELRYNAPEEQPVIVPNATVTAVGADSVWVQTGAGEYQGIRVTCLGEPQRTAGVAAGDVVDVEGIKQWLPPIDQTIVSICNSGGITVTGVGAGTPTAIDIIQSIGGEQYEGVLVRISGSLSITGVTTDDPVFGSFYSIAGTEEGTIAGRPWLYDPTQDAQALPNFASGATMTAVVGIVDSMTDSRQDLMPRSAADFENYTPAP
ncbi:MAG: hypothetical protein H6718_23330 [Polyangiaceae bacterium]|nr:hypothetical protein [Polyangiaceae bacterium]